MKLSHHKATETKYSLPEIDYIVTALVETACNVPLTY
jgi:hypothetical protein